MSISISIIVIALSGVGQNFQYGSLLTINQSKDVTSLVISMCNSFLAALKYSTSIINVVLGLPDSFITTKTLFY